MKLRELFDSARRIEGSLLAAVGCAVFAVWVFIVVADEVVEGDVHAFDRMVLLALRNPADPADPIGPGWLEEFGRDMTALGGIGFLTLLVAALCGLLILMRKQRAVALILLSTGSGLLLSTLLKHGFDRPRPDLVPHGSIVYTASFPSGHSMMAAVTYLTLAALLASLYKERRIKIYLVGLAVLLTVMVGVSRVYLGVHWPTDVIAGWAVGSAWALAWWTFAQWLQRRGSIEPESRTLPDP